MTLTQVAYYRVKEEAFKREVRDLHIRKDWAPTLQTIKRCQVAEKITSSPLNSPRMPKATPRSLEAAGSMTLNSARATTAELRRKSGTDATVHAAAEAGILPAETREAVGDKVDDILKQLANPGGGQPGRQPQLPLDGGPLTSSGVIGWRDNSNAALASMASLERRNHNRWSRPVRYSDLTVFSEAYASRFGTSVYSKQK